MKKPRTRGQLVREVSFLTRPHHLRINLGKGANLLVMMRWAAGFSADLELSDFADFRCADSTKLGVPDWSRVDRFNARIRAACTRGDELAKAAGEDKMSYFESILADAEDKAK